MWKVIRLWLRFKIDPCDIHEDVGEVMLFDTGFKTMVIDFFVIIDVPKGRGEFFLIFVIKFFDFLLHPSVLKHCIFNRNQSTPYILCILFSLRQNIFICPVEFFRVEATCWVDLVGSVLALEYFTSSRDMLQDADFNVLMRGEIESFVFAVWGVIKFGVIVHQRLFFINNIIGYKQSC